MYFILGKETAFRRAILSGWAALGSGKQVVLGCIADSTMVGKPESIDAARAIYSILRAWARDHEHEHEQLRDRRARALGQARARWGKLSLWVVAVVVALADLEDGQWR